MVYDEHIAQFTNIFKWSLDAIALIKSNRIIFVNGSVEISLPFVKVGMNPMLFVSNELKNQIREFKELSKTFENVRIRDVTCSFSITRMKEFEIVKFFDIVSDREKKIQNQLPPYRRLQHECADMRAQVSKIASLTVMIALEVPPQYYAGLSDQFAFITQCCHILQKRADNVDSIATIMNPNNDDYTVSNFSESVRNFAESFKSHLIPKNVSLFLGNIQENILVPCDRDKIRLAIYNVFECILDCICDRGCITIALEKSNERATLHIYVVSANLNKKIFSDMFAPGSERINCARSIAENYDGGLVCDAEKMELAFSVSSKLRSGPFVRTPEAVYDSGNSIGILSELSKVFSREDYRRLLVEIPDLHEK